jgi:chemosensory pili system protein ChpA (sensor histidine kinase/response regulator)
MGDRHDYVALEWVKGEIGETLKQARQAIETFVENPREPVPLYLCRDYLHQVHGTLQMVEFYGAALLAEEMEQLTEALVEGRVASQRDALETLMQAILQLPAYLDRVQEARRDLPVIVLPLLNDLRAARGENLLSETSLFSPDLSSIQRLDSVEQADANDELVAHLRKFRQMLQVALAGVVRNQDVSQNLGYMAKVFERLERLCNGMPVAALWGASLAVVEGLHNGGIANGTSVRNLLRQVDKEFKSLLAERIGLGHSAPEELIKNLLFYVAKASIDSPNVLRQKQKYRLEEALPDTRTVTVERARFSGPDRDAMRSAVTALCEELVRVKDSFDLFVRSERRDPASLDSLLVPVKQIADTLAMLGLGQLRKTALEQYHLLQQLSRGEVVAYDQDLMDIASALLFIEASLADNVAPKEGARTESNLLPSTDVAKIHQVVVVEARKGLEQAKDAMIEFIVSQWNHDHLRPVPELLRQIRGGLAMIPLQRAADLLDACGRYIQDQMLANSAIPDWQNLDTLADAITSVEYYLERLVEDPESESDAILDVARDRLESLGYPPVSHSIEGALGPLADPLQDLELSAAEADALSVDAEPFDESKALADGPAYEQPIGMADTQDSDALLDSLDEPLGFDLEEPVAEGWDRPDSDDISDISFPDEAVTAEELTPGTIEDVMNAPALPFNPPARDVPPTLLPPPADEEPVDEELREVFVEEAGEVLDALREQLPMWRTDPTGRAPLTEIRRAFHTLKGSGRMVRALVIGELAWSVENLLNRVLDGTREPDANVVHAVDEVVAVIPELVQQFADHTQCQRDDVDLLAANAHALAKGEPTLLIIEAESTAAAHSDPEPVQDALPPVKVAEVLDPQLLDVFRNEAETHIQSLVAYLDACAESLPQPVTDNLQRALHTLKGSASMAGIQPIADVAAPLERLAKEYKICQVRIDLAEADLLAEALGLFTLGLEQLELSPLEPIPGGEDFIRRVGERQQERLGTSASTSSSDRRSQGSQALLPMLSDGMDHLLAAEELLRAWQENPSGSHDIERLSHALGELKDGASQAGLPQLHSLAGHLDDVYRAVGDGRVATSDRFFSEAGLAHDALVGMIDQAAAGLDVQARPDREAALDALLTSVTGEAQEPDAYEPFELDAAALAQSGVEQSVESEQDQEDQEDLAWLDDTEFALFDSSEQLALADVGEDLRAMSLEEEMVSIFLDEAVDILSSANEALDRWQADTDGEAALNALQRDLHTLKGGARMAEVEPISRLAHELEGLYEGLLDKRFARIETLPALLEDCHDHLALQLDQLQAGRDLASPDTLIDQIGAIREQASQSVPSASPSADAQDLPFDDGMSNELMEAFLGEAGDLIERMSVCLQQWEDAPNDRETLIPLRRDLHTLKGNARLADLRPVSELAHELEAVYSDLAASRLSATPDMFNLLHRCHDGISDLFDACRAQQPLSPRPDLIGDLKDARSRASNVPVFSALAPAPVAEPRPVILPDEESDEEILDIFLEEGDDLLEEMEAAIGQWEADRSATEPVEAILRVLHTLKGGARLAGLTQMGDLAHALEQSFAEGEIQPGPMLDNSIVKVQAGYEQLASELQVLRDRLKQGGETPLDLEQPAAAMDDEVIRAAPVARPVTEEPDLPFMRRATEVAQEMAVRRSSREMVRVPAELLDGLVNLAGETSIYRGRVEQQVSDFAFTLGEMDATIERVRDQLRRLDTETQAQILSRYQAEGERAGYEEFDPLEMDRYSQLQQLSRSLFESASDLLDLKETLSARNRDAETLLQQQAWVNTELQEGLMRTRMVPFDRMVPRLRRIVRQVAGELGKQVDFIVDNAEGELDRTVLERMVAPLEHMLRNAVDHGIESSEKREAAAKPKAGQIRLTLAREGGDILITLSDDGRGIALDAVKRKALERGLITEASGLSDQELLQFILESGFSTAEQVTQISGRGVGMDVVHSEVKQLGGSMIIDSTAGEGTRFLIRLPFTVSVNRALMVRAGDDTYAVPLNTVEGIVRVSPYELDALYAMESPKYVYAGEEYALTYLGDLLENGQHPKLAGQSLPLPIILVRSSEHAVAIQVDALAGSREIVVKSLGPQFAAVPGLSGATILGDGRVVVILDLMATIRARHARALPSSRPGALSAPAQEVQPDRPPLVMVVDDSITVRKVTGRLIERNGMNVITAKDGVDAISQLQERKPDIMLLDIEMPRMDGFEVATLVRHDERLKDLPIIMITSRTGEKHRERAMAIGVNEYLGKPYQEGALLASIQQLVGRHSAGRQSRE